MKLTNVIVGAYLTAATIMPAANYINNQIESYKKSTSEKDMDKARNEIPWELFTFLGAAYFMGDSTIKKIKKEN